MNKQDAYKLVNELLASRVYSTDKNHQLAYERGLLIGLLTQAMHNDSSIVGEVRRRIRQNRGAGSLGGFPSANQSERSAELSTDFW